MEQNTFVDRFFHSSCELTDFRKTGERDINTLFSFLNNLHSLQDRVREQFGKTISQHPEFKLLRISETIIITSATLMNSEFLILGMNFHLAILR
ncbi:Uncharacterised protein [Klebsiella aerogenes]|nr:Uncharacterised protein [Klebsiella aerogenes]